MPHGAIEEFPRLRVGSGVPSRQDAADLPEVDGVGIAARFRKTRIGSSPCEHPKLQGIVTAQGNCHALMAGIDRTA